MILAFAPSSYAKEASLAPVSKKCNSKIIKNKKNCKYDICQCEKPKANSCEKNRCDFPHKKES
jgi:hypothetical protein